MKKLAIAAIAIAVLASGCKKIENAVGVKQGTIRFTNRSNNDYKIYIDGSSAGTVPGKSFKEAKKSAGRYRLKAVQSEGYAFYPTEVSVTVQLSEGQEQEFVFP